MKYSHDFLISTVPVLVPPWQWCLKNLIICCMFCVPQLSQDEATTFYDELNHHIFELVSSSDVNEKKGGILAIGKFQARASHSGDYEPGLCGRLASDVAISFQ